MTLDFEDRTLELFFSWEPVVINLDTFIIYGGFVEETLFLRLFNKFFKAWSFFNFYASYFFLY